MVGTQQQAEAEAEHQRQHQVVLPLRHLRQNRPTKQCLMRLTCAIKNQSFLVAGAMRASVAEHPGDVMGSG